MASASKRQRIDLISGEEVLERIFNNEDSAEGMDSGEESDLDRQLENETGKSRWVFFRSLCEIDAIERVIVECCGMQIYTLQIAFLAFGISSTS